MVMTCIRYLSFDAFAAGPCMSSEGKMAKDDLKERKSRYPFLEYAVRCWAFHAREAPISAVNESSLTFLGQLNLASSALQATHRRRSRRCWESRQAVRLPQTFYYWEATEDYTALLVAALIGLDNAARRLIENGAIADARDSLGCTALLLAAKEGHEDIVLWLSRRGDVNVNASNVHGDTPRGVALSPDGHEAIVRLLLRSGANPNIGNLRSTNLYEAIAWHEVDIVRLLMEAGADMNAETSNRSSIFHAIPFSGSKSAMSFLVLLEEYGVDLNPQSSHGDSVWLSAARWKDLESMKYLLDNDANTNSCDESEQTALHILLEGQDDEDILISAIHLLAEARADFNCLDCWRCTPLHRAARAGSPKVIGVLLEHGADIHATGNEGDTPLLEALRKVHICTIVLERLSKLEYECFLKMAPMSKTRTTVGIVRFTWRLKDKH